MLHSRARVTVSPALTTERALALEALPGVCTSRAPYLGQDRLIPATPDPGPWLQGHSIDAPLDILGTVVAWVAGWHLGWTLTVYRKSGAPPEPTPCSVEDLTDVLPAYREQAFPFQREGFERFHRMSGGLAHWDCGTGKTLLSVFFLAADPGREIRPRLNGTLLAAPRRRVVIVTLPTTCYQFASVLEHTFVPGRAPAVVLEEESSLSLKRCGPPRQFVWKRKHDLRMGLAKEIQLGPLRKAPPKKMTHEEGDILPRSALRSVQNYYEIWPVLPEEQEDAIAAAGEVLVDPPSAWLPYLEALPTAGDEHVQVIRRRDKAIIGDFTGREPVRLLSRVRNQLMGEAIGSEVTPARRLDIQVLLRSDEGADIATIQQETGLAEAHILALRARVGAEACRDQYRSICDLPPHIEVCILSWNLLPARREWLADWQPTTLILDEVQNAKSQRIWTVDVHFGKNVYTYANSVAASAHMLAHQVPRPRVLELSADPCPNLIPDWWSPLQILTQGWGKSRAFSDRYADGRMTEITEHRTIYKAEGATNTPEFDARIAPYVHRVLKSQLAGIVPATMREVIRIPARELVNVTIPEKEWRAARERGSQGLQEMYVLHAAAMKRPYILKRALEHLDQGWKVVIFSGRILDCDQTFNELRAARPDLDMWCYHGENLPPNHGELLRSFAYDTWMPHAGPALLVGTEDVWGVGIDGLQTTHRCIRARLPINPIQLSQPEGRFGRPIPPHLPQISTVIEYVHAEGTIDDRIMELFENKMHVVGQTYGVFRERMSDALATFHGHRNAEEAMQTLSDQLVSGMPMSMFENYEDDE